MKPSNGRRKPGSTDDATRQHIRGSTLLLLGRVISLALNFASQVIIVRYLSKHDYGAFAFGLSMVMTASEFALFGMKDVASRFTPIYEQKRDYDRMFGTLLLMVALVMGLGLAVIVAAFGLRGTLADTMQIDPLPLALLMVLIVLVPVEALDRLLISLFAVFAGARGVFVRRHVLGPILKLSAVGGVVLMGGSVYWMALGYVAAGGVGIVIYLWLLAFVLHKKQLWRNLNFSTIRIPAREIFAFSTPLLASELFLLLRGSLVVMLLASYHGPTSVAAFRAVVPVAVLSRLVAQNFRILYLPNASRLFAQGRYEEVDRIYWQTAVWIAVFTFPLFCVCFALSGPIIVMLFGRQYADSAGILSLLSLGYYFHASLGFNQQTMKVFGRSFSILAVDLFSVITIVLVNLWLIPRYGAFGGAVGTCVTLIAHNVFTQIGLALFTPVKAFRFRYAKPYASIVAGALFVLAVQQIWPLPLVAGILLIVLVWGGILIVAQDSLQVGDTFPELLRIPFVRRLRAPSG